MAQDIVNANQSLSYTNLDFSSIYTEVLDMVKQLTKKWDPSISDESDPGVVLVKLSALLADKMNYNIDKNILEAFPLSVTQDSNARQLYEQLGYYMHWYQAATVPVVLSWKTTTVDENGDAIAYTIPKFTTITDDNETVVYSLVGALGEDGVVVSDGLLYTDSSKNLNMFAYEGIPVQYTFNDRTTITSNMVDSNNRLYLSTAYVFENGIFIKNVEQDNYSEWHRVNNLYEYSYDVHRYKFGYDSAANLCYLEFPDNYAELFGSGIELVYLTFATDESYSDVPTQFLSKFLATVTVGTNNEVTLSPDNVKISNTEPAFGHAEKEDIDDAYKNYKKTVGTFHTLVTLRDYLNYITSQEVDICSNAFVTDRTNDIQSTYKIISKHNGVDSLINEVEDDKSIARFVKTTDQDVMSGKDYYTWDSNTGSFNKVSTPAVADLNSYYEFVGEDKMSPFSLKFYLLQKAVALTARGAYDNTFEMSHSDDLDMDALLGNTSHLVHNFEEIESIEEGTYTLTTDTAVVSNTIYYFYNSVYSRYEPVSTTSLSYATFNPRAMSLYEAGAYSRATDASWVENKDYYKYENGSYTLMTAPYPDTSPTQTDDVYVISEYILTKDTNIDNSKRYYKKNPDEDAYTVATLPESGSDINPNTLGLYVQSEEPLLSHIVFLKNKYPITMSISTYNTVNKTVRDEILTNVVTAFYNNLDSSNIEFGDAISLDYLTEVAKNSDTRIKNVAFEALTYTTSAIYWDEHQQSFFEVELPAASNAVGLSSVSISPTYNDVIAYLFSKEIICKSILAGTTQLIVPDTTFAYHLNQKYMNQISNVKYITGEATIDMNRQEPHYLMAETVPMIMKSYTLQENETISLFRPSISDVETYTSGVHYEYLTYSDIRSGQSRQLGIGEWFIFYISNVDSDGILQSFNVFVYGEGAIIHPTFDIEARGTLTTYGETAVGIATASGAISETSVDTKVYSYTESRSAQVSQISTDTAINNTKIATNQSISAQKLDRFTVEESDGYRMMWHLNDPIYDGAVKQYQLFDSYDPSDAEEVTHVDSINSYTLKSGEYLYYTDASLSNLGILGAGTTIYRECGTSTYSMSDIDVLPVIYLNWNNRDLGQFTELSNPSTSGLFELSGNAYIRTTDSSYEQGKNYYVLLMRDVSGWYIKNPDNTYTQTSAPTTTVFRSVIPAAGDNPASLGLFEQVIVGNEAVVDTYLMPTKFCTAEEYVNSSDYRGELAPLIRYTLTIDTSPTSGKIYYELNNYATKSFRTIDPLVCPAIDTLDLTSNPMQVMRKLFQNVQTNTALTFTRNEVWTISQGDTIYFQTPTSSISETVLPTFTNTETILDLDTYDISYKRVGDSTVTLDNITIKDCFWQGYSNLQLNTNNEDGQHLLENHTLTAYGPESTETQLPVLLYTVAGTEDTNIHFQLQYPVVNRTGSFIQVDTHTMTEDEILNMLYVYNISPDGEDYAYSSDNHSTYVYIKRADEALQNDGKVAIADIALASGSYLIPINGLSDKRITLQFTGIKVPEISETSVDTSLFTFNPEVFLSSEMGTWLQENPSGSVTLGFNSSQGRWLWVGHTSLGAIDLSSCGINYSGTPSSYEYFTIKLADERLVSYVDGKNYFLGDRLHFAQFNVPAGVTGSLVVSVTDKNGNPLTNLDISESITVVLNDIFKFEPNSIFTSCYDELRQKIAELDVNQMYDYTYVPSEDDLIPDPLVPRAFWNKNHVYNPFTIAQLNADNIVQNTRFIT